MREPTPRPSELRLREMLEDDLPVFFEHQSDPGAARMVGFKPRDWPDFLKHWAGVLANPTVRGRTIVVEGEVAGHVAAFERDGRPEVGYWLGRAFWGRGIATRALSELLRLVPERPLYAQAAKHNAASIRVLEKCGFVRIAEDPHFATVDGARIEGVLLRLD